MKKWIKILMINTFLVLGFVSYGQIQLLSGIEDGTYFKLAKEMRDFLPDQMKVVDGDTSYFDLLDVRSTQGSTFNFDLIVDEKHPAKAAIMQLDLLLLKKSEDMIEGTKLSDDLLILMPLSMEDIHLVTKKDSDIKSLKSLEGKIVGIGKHTEGTYSTSLYIQNTSKLSWHNRNVSSEEALRELLLDKIDAFFLVAGSPVQLLAANPLNSPLRMSLAEVENFNGWADYYTPVTLGPETYRFLQENVNTFSVPSVIVVNKKKITDEDIVLLKEWRDAIISGIEDLKANGHKSWLRSDPAGWNSDYWPVLE
jgi:TRAP transporter TAXI family solute receptor